MGCGSGKLCPPPAQSPSAAKLQPHSRPDHGGPPYDLPDAERVKKCPDVSLRSDPLAEDQKRFYTLAQSFAIVRHGDRLDHTPAWENHPEARAYPNDTPLTRDGHMHATAVGEALKASGKPFGLIISSPYYRCAQTACRIAEVLDLPIHFDLDLGEVFDSVSILGDIGGKPQHRPAKVLEAALSKDFTNVTWIRDQANRIKVEGKLQHFPEDFDSARMRYCYKVKKLLQKAAAELMSVVIVTHGDALAAVVGLLRENLRICSVPYTAYALATRMVKVMDEGGDRILQEEPVYVHPDDWQLELSPGFETKEMYGAAAKKAHKKHMREMVAMNAQAEEIQTTYKLDDEQVERFRKVLNHLEAHDADIQHLIHKAGSSHHLGADRENRIMCAPKGA